MNVGDLVRLKQPLLPTPTTLQVYRFGLVAGVVSEGVKTEVLVHLFDPQSAQVYTDESGIQAIYSFQLDEVEYRGNYQT